MKAITKEYVRGLIAELRETTEVREFAIAERRDTGEIVGLHITCTKHGVSVGVQVKSVWSDTLVSWADYDDGPYWDDGEVYAPSPYSMIVTRCVEEDYFSADPVGATVEADRLQRCPGCHRADCELVGAIEGE